MRKALTHLKKSDPIMRAIIERIGPCRMRMGRPEFHSLAEAIVYQQLNGKAAVTIFKRFAALAGEPLTPEGILKLSDEQMRSAGLSKQKSAYLKDLAAKTTAGQLDFVRLPELPDHEEVVPESNKALREFEPADEKPTEIQRRRAVQRRFIDNARQASLDFGDDMGM